MSTAPRTEQSKPGKKKNATVLKNCAAASVISLPKIGPILAFSAMLEFVFIAMLRSQARMAVHKAELVGPNVISTSR